MFTFRCLKKVVVRVHVVYMSSCTMSGRLVVALVSSKQGQCLLTDLVSSKQCQSLLMAHVSS